jgi:hypothetical protein
MANVLGFSHGIDPALAQSHGLLLFAAFTAAGGGGVRGGLAVGAALAA